MSDAVHATHDASFGRIGPNAITRVAEALGAIDGAGAVRRVFETAGLTDYLAAAPADMVDERHVTRLHLALRGDLGGARARTVGWIAGQRTADYLLAHRIPQLAQRLLRALPAPAASRLLARAIAGNAWTFAGTGSFAARHGRPTTFTIANCPICRGQDATSPYCDFYAATFERLYGRLVHAGARVVETDCQAMGARACVFTIAW
ncbi:bacteriochlorophyll 4-vinyl reductase [Rhodopseudomonas sp. P2A-2r]|uniref:bacteriochlorophyll 4-vinyl reductase n=1 Tax=unclassified Rhodopseudomonas TaxID=2638247 RepID=UPI002234D46F|nr:bacteriochlorophyll 4-vinyl reductase [Rhodopseudomonas sp. P2A-2r]UZE49510.1 bacteriochlorophyll 4-vinyl reductase [Rhodopseudomonas sp. P2A-2r]